MPQNNLEDHREGKSLSGLRKWFRRANIFGVGEKENLKQRIVQQEEQIRQLNNLLGKERKRSIQLALLSEIEQSLKIVLDQPVAAQLAVNAIQRAFNCDVVTVLVFNAEHKDFSVLAVSGKGKWYLPPSYRHRADQGLIGRAANQRKTILANDTRLEKDYLQFEGQGFLSEMIVPLILNGDLKGVLTIDHEKAGAFSASDSNTLEIVAEQLMSAWERSSYQQRLTDLIQGGITLSTLLDTQAVIDQLAQIARKALEARFAFVSLLDQDGSFTRIAHAGNAPQLLRALRKKPEKDPLIQTILNANSIMRVRDIRKSQALSHLKIEQTNFRGMLAFPIRLHELNIGVILVFDKQRQAIFTENDESLANLIASQAAAAIEGTWLYQELRSTLQTATLLYQLSARVTQAENMSQASEAIIETAFKLGYASLCGIVLFTLDRQVQVQLEINDTGTHFNTPYPKQAVEQALETKQTIVLTDEYFSSKVCIPLQTSHRIYGALWLDIPESRWYNSRYSANLQSLANQATIALERSQLLVQTSNQAKQLEAAYHELETTYDQTLAALTSALDARDRETEGHSSRVGKIACRLGEELRLSSRQIKALERGALLHDIGKIGVSDTILLKPGPLTEEEWQIMRRHPEIGARIVESIPFLAETTTVLRYHHEHWDGSGYPIGLARDEIPLLARIFSVVDAFDAMVSDRPYRKGTTEKEATNYLMAKIGILYDPDIVNVFVAMLKDRRFSDVLRRK
jgi:putative nucleotidyltransferase with HDIG domain